MLFYTKDRPFTKAYMLRLHYDPKEITDERTTTYIKNPSKETVPSEQFESPEPRSTTFIVLFNDFASGITLGKQDGRLSTRDSILWLRQRQQANPPLWDQPPVLGFTGLRAEVGSRPYYCVIEKTRVVSKIHAGPLVLARPSLLSADATTAIKPGSPGVDLNADISARNKGIKVDDIVRAEVEITLKEVFVSQNSVPTGLVEAFQLGARNGARAEGQ